MATASTIIRSNAKAAMIGDGFMVTRQLGFVQKISGLLFRFIFDFGDDRLISFIRKLSAALFATGAAERGLDFYAIAGESEEEALSKGSISMEAIAVFMTRDYVSKSTNAHKTLAKYGASLHLGSNFFSGATLVWRQRELNFQGIPTPFPTWGGVCF